MRNFKTFLTEYKKCTKCNFDGLGDEQLVHFVKEAIAAHQEYYWKEVKNFCAVCGVTLTYLEKEANSPNNFNSVCRSHSSFRDVWNIDLELEREGMPKRAVVRYDFFKP